MIISSDDFNVLCFCPKVVALDPTVFGITTDILILIRVSLRSMLGAGFPCFVPRRMISDCCLETN
jgi:hypothetical protein